MSTGGSLPRLGVDRSAAPGVLHGVRVVDLSRLVAGNMLTLQLADFGADVIKVESAGSGDTLREWCEPHPSRQEGFDGWWQVYGRNKRSLALNLRDAQAMGWLRRLIDTAQVMVESFKPGTLEAMGLAPQTLHASNPKLVLVRLSGWGQSGPYRGLPGFGSLIEGFSGYAHRHRDAEGVPRLPDMALADMVTGLTGAFATLAALREVEVRGGVGQVIDLSLLEPMVAIMGPDVTNLVETGREPKVAAKIASPRGSYRCRDGRWIALSGSTDTMARRVFEAIGAGDAFEQPRFATNAARLANDTEVDRMVAAFVAQRDRDDVLALLRDRGVTVAPIHGPADLVTDPHVIERGVFVSLEDDTGGSAVVMHDVVPRLSRTPGRIRRAAAPRGAHTLEVLRSIGADEGELAALHARTAIEAP